MSLTFDLLMLATNLKVSHGINLLRSQARQYGRRSFNARLTRKTCHFVPTRNVTAAGSSSRSLRPITPVTLEAVPMTTSVSHVFERFENVLEGTKLALVYNFDCRIKMRIFQLLEGLSQLSTLNLSGFSELCC